MLDVDDLHFAYDGKKLLEGVSFSVDAGEIVALIGISGSGKTTLFKLIAGLMEPCGGEVRVGGAVSQERAQMMTYMRQEDLLLPWRTVMGNLLLFTELGRKKGEGRILQQQGKELLERVGLAGYENYYPKELSGGMRQRVALARALIQNRPLMLLDEPFASLDVILREQLYALLRAIRDQYNKTLIMVTHDFRDAMALADRILVLAQGKIVSTYYTHSIPNEELFKQIREDLAVQSSG